MFIPEFEMKILKELRPQWEEYHELFGEYFPPFNHDQWFAVGDKTAINVFRDTLLECVKTKTRFKRS